MSNTGAIGIIGGSGVYNIDAVEVVKEHDIDTPYGKPSSAVMELSVSGAKCFFIPRHGKGHVYLPSEVNYRANIFALKKLGVKHIISISAVGSLQEECAPGDFVLPDQFIDWTKGIRARTFFGEGVVGHVSAAYPIEAGLQKVLADHCQKNDIKTHVGGSYLCIEGPQFSSRAESTIYRGFGARVIGMTNVPEAYLAKEAGMAYATVAMVTDYDCWKEVHCTVDEIMKVMKGNNISAQKLIMDVIPYLNENPVEFVPENQFGILTPKENWSGSQREIMEVLLA